MRLRRSFWRRSWPTNRIVRMSTFAPEGPPPGALDALLGGGAGAPAPEEEVVEEAAPRTPEDIMSELLSLAKEFMDHDATDIEEDEKMAGILRDLNKLLGAAQSANQDGLTALSRLGRRGGSVQ